MQEYWTPLHASVFENDRSYLFGRLPVRFLARSLFAFCRVYARAMCDMISLLAADYVPLLLLTCSDVDPPTKVKMEELLGTWRTGGQDGGELFKPVPNAPVGTLPPQRIIEDALFGRPPAPVAPPVPPMQPIPSFQNGGQPYHQQSPPPVPAPPQWQQQQQHPRPPTPPKPQHSSDPTNVEKAEVLFDIRKMLEMRRSQLVANPSNRGNLDQINTLKQVSQCSVWPMLHYAHNAD